MKRALITGITGQDGSYLADLLVEQGYEVYGVMRRSSVFNTGRIDHLLFPGEKITTLYGDLANGIDGIISDLKPDLIFNTAAMSYVAASFDIPLYTMDVNAIGPARILEAIRHLGLKDKTRFLQCSSSEMFGISPPPQNETTQFQPQSPYGISKVAAFWITKTYRNAFKLFAANSICFNHESPRRGENFVTKKIIRSAVRIKLGKQQDLVLGNLKAKRDWGHSKDYCAAMLAVISHSEPDDFVIATGFQHTIEDFVTIVFDKLGLDYQKHVKINTKHFRPLEVPDLLGDASKIRSVLSWEPKISFSEMIDDMLSSVMKEESIRSA